jgi:membrane-bound ClpP family serine protease
MARLGDRRVDVVTESRFVEPGEKVVVVAQRDLRVVVRPLESPPESPGKSRW